MGSRAAELVVRNHDGAAGGTQGADREVFGRGSGRWPLSLYFWNVLTGGTQNPRTKCPDGGPSYEGYSTTSYESGPSYEGYSTTSYESQGSPLEKLVSAPRRNIL